MNQSLKAILQLITIVCGCVSIAVWGMPRYPNTVIWASRFAFPVLTVVLAYVLHRSASKPDLVPDFLFAKMDWAFERDGLCFMPETRITSDRICWFDIFFQNRYAGDCVCDLVIQPPVKNLGVRRHDVPTIAVEIACPGGAFGVVRVPYPIPAKNQGREMSYEVGARTRYPAGKGKMLRFREGSQAGAHETAFGSAAKTIGLAAVGVNRLKGPATFAIDLPAQVSEELPKGAAITSEILWVYDASLGDAFLTENRQSTMR